VGKRGHGKSIWRGSGRIVSATRKKGPWWCQQNSNITPRDQYEVRPQATKRRRKSGGGSLDNEKSEEGHETPCPGGGTEASNKVLNQEKEFEEGGRTGGISIIRGGGGGLTECAFMWLRHD